MVVNLDDSSEKTQTVASSSECAARDKCNSWGHGSAVCSYSRIVPQPQQPIKRGARVRLSGTMGLWEIGTSPRSCQAKAGKE